MSHQMTSFNLSQAIEIIAMQFPKSQVTAIQFEDGSGLNFNYQLDGGKWQFISFPKPQLTNPHG